MRSDVLVTLVLGSIATSTASAGTRVSDCGDDCYIGTIIPIGLFVIFLLLAVVYLMWPPNYKATRVEMERRAQEAKQREMDIQRAIEEHDTKEAMARNNSSFTSNKA